MLHKASPNFAHAPQSATTEPHGDGSIVIKRLSHPIWMWSSSLRAGTGKVTHSWRDGPGNTWPLTPYSALSTGCPAFVNSLPAIFVTLKCRWLGLTFKRFFKFHVVCVCMCVCYICSCVYECTHVDVGVFVRVLKTYSCVWRQVYLYVYSCVCA